MLLDALQSFISLLNMPFHAQAHSSTYMKQDKKNLLFSTQRCLLWQEITNFWKNVECWNPHCSPSFLCFHHKIIYIYILLHVDLIGQLHVYTGQHLKLFKSHNDHSLFNTMQRILCQEPRLMELIGLSVGRSKCQNSELISVKLIPAIAYSQ